MDPLASNKGFWGEILGVGDFYYEVAVQIVDICLQTRAQNGGLIDLRELQARLVRVSCCAAVLLCCVCVRERARMLCVYVCRCVRACCNFGGWVDPPFHVGCFFLLFHDQATKRGGHASKVGRDDMERAIQKLKILGSGFNIVRVGARTMVVSVPYELNRDHSTVLSCAEATGCVLARGVWACGASAMLWHVDGVQ